MIKIDKLIVCLYCLLVHIFVSRRTTGLGECERCFTRSSLGDEELRICLTQSCPSLVFELSKLKLLIVEPRCLVPPVLFTFLRLPLQLVFTFLCLAPQLVFTFLCIPPPLL